MTVLLGIVAVVLMGVPAAVSQVANGQEGGLDVFAPFGQHGQILAQATCTAMRANTGFVFAVQRFCEPDQPSCEQICRGLSEQQAGGLSCFGALHIYANRFFHEPETLGLKTLVQTSCEVSACGPNYCCCGN